MLSGEDDKYKAFSMGNFLTLVKLRIISNTNCNLSKLKVLIDIFKGCEIKFVIIDTPKSICISRLPSDAQHMAEIIDKFEEEMIQTVKWLKDNKLDVKEI